MCGSGGGQRACMQLFSQPLPLYGFFLLHHLSQDIRICRQVAEKARDTRPTVRCGQTIELLLRLTYKLAKG